MPQDKSRRPRGKRGRLLRSPRWVLLALAGLVVVSVAAPLSMQWLGSHQRIALLSEHARDIQPVAHLRFSQMRGISFYEYGYDTSSPTQLHDLQTDLPLMQSAGFNTVRLVSLWASFEPVAQPTPQYSTAAFANLRSILQVLKEHHMHALLGVTYVGPGWVPAGIDYCTWFTNPVEYRVYEQFVQTFLRNILDYADMADILVFNEMAIPCGMNEFQQAKQIAVWLQPTLGSLPKRLPADLRKAFTIGFQEDALISLGWGGGETPIQSPISYDFLAMTFYNPDRSDFDVVHDQYSVGCALSIVLPCTLQKMQKRQARFTQLYSNTPLLITEAGATHCDTTLDHQAQVESAIVTVAQQLAIGLTLWAWRSGPANADCSADWTFKGLGITTDQGMPTVVSSAVQALLGVPPQIVKTGVSMVGRTPAIWIQPQSSANALQARVYIGTQRLDNVTFTYSTTAVSFTLPATGPTAHCDGAHICHVIVQLVDPLNGLASDLVPVSVPSS